MRKLPIIILTSIVSISISISISISTGIFTGAVAENSNNSETIDKKLFIKNYEKTGPIEACDELKKSDKSKVFKLPGLEKNNKVCISLISPMIKKYLNQHAGAFPEKLHNNQLKTYKSEVISSASKEYIIEYMEIPKKAFLAEYMKSSTLLPLCENLKKVPVDTCLKNVKFIMKGCIAKVEHKLPDTLTYKDFEIVNKDIQPCLLKDYLPMTILK